MTKSPLDPEWDPKKHTSLFPLVLSNLVGHKVSVTEDELGHYLSGAIFVGF